MSNLFSMDAEESQRLVSVGFKKLPDSSDSCYSSQLSLNHKDDEPTNPCLCQSVESLEQNSSKCIYSCRLLHEFTVQVCKIGRCNNVLGKICNSNYFRKWYSLRLVLTSTDIRSKCATELGDFPISFLNLKSLKVLPIFDSGQNYMVKIPVSDGFILIKTFESQILNQLLHALNWKRRVWDFERALKRNSSLDLWSEEIKEIVQFSMNSPILDPVIKQQPFSVAARIFVSRIKKDANSSSCSSSSSSSPSSSSSSSPSPSSLIASLFAVPFQESFPLSPSMDIRMFFATFGEECFSGEETREMYFYVVEWIIKHNSDFCKNPTDKQLVMGYIECAARHFQDLEDFIQVFVSRIHGSSSRCPHLRILHNLFSICADVIGKHFNLNTNNNSSASSSTSGSNLFDDDGDDDQEFHHLRLPPPHRSHHHHHHHRITRSQNQQHDEMDGRILEAYLNILKCLSSFSDWRQELSSLLQSIPFCVEALSDKIFIKHIKVVLKNMIGDGRCSIHQSVLGSRPGRSGWFELCAPWGKDGEGPDGGTELHCEMLEVLLGCCCHRRKFFITRRTLVPQWLRMADKKENPAIKALCGCVEFDVLDEEDDLKQQVVLMLEGSEEGRRALELSEERDRINYQQSGSGPRKLSLPSKATDQDLKTILSAGCYKDLEALSLAFTRCTGSCADDLINLPSLKELNLWSTQFNDSGLQLICDHLHDLQSLNLCETSVTSQGIMCLASLKKLKKLNLNSTNISLSDFERLRELLPDLQDVDIRYTDAWNSFT